MSLERTRLIKAIKAAELTSAQLDAMINANPMLRADLIDLVKTGSLFQRDFYGIPLYKTMKDSFAFIEAWLLGASDVDVFKTSEIVLDSAAKIDWCLGAGNMYSKLDAAGQDHKRLTLAGNDVANAHLWANSQEPPTRLIGDFTLSETLSSDPGFSTTGGFYMTLNNIPEGLKARARLDYDSNSTRQTAITFNSTTWDTVVQYLSSNPNWHDSDSTSDISDTLRLWFAAYNSANDPLMNVETGGLQVYTYSSTYDYHITGLRLTPA